MPSGRRVVMLGAAIAALALVVIALTQARGPFAAALVMPWLAMTGAVAIAAIVRLVRSALERGLRADAWAAGMAAAMGFLTVGAAWAVIDRAGGRPFGFGATIVLLTAVHFHVAGFLLTLAGSVAARARPTWPSIAAVAILVVGMPLTALGFFGLPMLSWIGAILVAAGGLGIGATTILVARSRSNAIARVALTAGGATLFVTMPLAVAYATGSTFGIASLDVPQMAAIHGGLNVVGFALPTMIGWSVTER
jgi:hypothetical protein